MGGIPLNNSIFFPPLLLWFGGGQPKQSWGRGGNIGWRSVYCNREGGGFLGIKLFLYRSTFPRHVIKFKVPIRTAPVNMSDLRRERFSSHLWSVWSFQGNAFCFQSIGMNDCVRVFIRQNLVGALSAPFIYGAFTSDRTNNWRPVFDSPWWGERILEIKRLDKIAALRSLAPL